MNPKYRTYILAVWLTLLACGCEWPFHPDPTPDLFTLNLELEPGRIVTGMPVHLSWEEITVEGFQSFRIEHKSTVDSAWIVSATLNDPFRRSYTDTLRDDEDVTYRVGIQDRDGNVRWAYADLVVPATRWVRVPEDVDSLQSAFNLPVLDDDDTLWVGPGKYKGGFRFAGKQVHILADGTWDDVILDGAQTGRVVTMSAGELAGFRIQFGLTQFSTPGGGVYISGNALVRNCLVTNNQADGVGDGVFLTGEGRLLNCLILDNGSEGVAASTAGGDIVNCTLDRNVVLIGPGCQHLTFRNNIIVSDVLPFHGINAYVDSVQIDYNFLPDPSLGDHTVSGDPLFMGGGDYHLQPTSPCLHAGHPDPAYNNRDGTRNTLGYTGGPFGE